MTDLPEDKRKPVNMLKRVVLWIALILFSVCAAGGGWFLSFVLRAGPETNAPTEIVDIGKGTSSQKIGSLLAEKKLIRDDGLRFLILVRLMGNAARLQAGEFRLHTGQTPVDLIIELSQARQIVHAVTIHEGLKIVEIAEKLSEGGWVDRDLFIAAAHDPEQIEAFDLGDIDSLEGYLFPDTYHLTKSGSDEAALVKMMVKRSLSVWNRFADQNETGLSRHEVYALASIIEKESGKDEERPIISAVFHNRLKKKMRLQSDPTVSYGIDDFDGTLTRTHLRTPTPYNTYTIPALPPGPICSPGEQSLRAVLFPAQVNYLYFVSKNNGTHYFSKTLREHNRAVRKFQRNRNSKPGS